MAYLDNAGLKTLWGLIKSYVDKKVASSGSSSDPNPVGTILMYGSDAAPSGYLKCDGTAVSRTTFANLFSVIGTTFGKGDGSTTFNLPNFNGRMPISYCYEQMNVNDSQTGTGKDSSPWPSQSDISVSKGWFGVGEHGGLGDVQLTTSEMPSHSHTANSAGAHTHSTTSAGDHTHAPGGNAKQFWISTQTDSLDSEAFSSLSGSGYKTPRTKKAYSNYGRSQTSSAGGHTHTANSAGGHTHTTTSVGGTSRHANLPPYLAVGFVIKY